MGIKSSKGYVTKFVAESLNSDYTTSSWTMDALSSGTDDITSDTGTMTAGSSISVTSGSYANQTVTYVAGTTTTTDVYYQISQQTFTLSPNTNSQLTLDTFIKNFEYQKFS